VVSIREEPAVLGIFGHLIAIIGEPKPVSGHRQKGIPSQVSAHAETRVKEVTKSGCRPSEGAP